MSLYLSKRFRDEDGLALVDEEDSNPGGGREDGTGPALSVVTSEKGASMIGEEGGGKERSS